MGAILPADTGVVRNEGGLPEVIALVMAGDLNMQLIVPLFLGLITEFPILLLVFLRDGWFFEWSRRTLERLEEWRDTAPSPFSVFKEVGIRLFTENAELREERRKHNLNKRTFQYQQDEFDILKHQHKEASRMQDKVDRDDSTTLH